jgi:hypothetical protein
MAVARQTPKRSLGAWTYSETTSKYRQALLKGIQHQNVLLKKTERAWRSYLLRDEIASRFDLCGLAGRTLIRRLTRFGMHYKTYRNRFARASLQAFLPTSVKPMCDQRVNP